MVEKLAVEGGTPVRGEPWPRRVHIGEAEVNAVMEVLKNAVEDPGKLWRMGGLETAEFEKRFAEFYGSSFAAASSSGTASIHLALAACRFEPGSEVITSPITDVGTVTPILFQNLIPVFADVDPETLNIDPDSVAERVTEKTRAVIPVHLSGLLCDMDPIMEIAEQHGLVVIEDCAQAHAAVYKGRMAGTIGDLGCFSLMAGKHITSGGEGGMTITDNEGLWRDTMLFARNIFTPWAQVHFDIRFPVLNYRMTELQAAIGLAQLPKLPGIVAARRRLCEKLASSMTHLETVRFSKVLEHTQPTFWFCMLHVDTDSIKVGIDDFAEALRMEGIPVAARYTVVPMYEYEFIASRQTYGLSKCPWTCRFYGKTIDYKDSCPNAAEALKRVLTLSLHENCTDKEVEDTVAALEKVEAHNKKG